MHSSGAGRVSQEVLVNKAVKSRCLAVRGDGNALLVPSKKGWLPHKGIPGDLWVSAVCF